MAHTVDRAEYDIGAIHQAPERLQALLLTAIVMQQAGFPRCGARAQMRQQLTAPADIEDAAAFELRRIFLGDGSDRIPFRHHCRPGLRGLDHQPEQCLQSLVLGLERGEPGARGGKAPAALLLERGPRRPQAPAATDLHASLRVGDAPCSARVRARRSCGPARRSSPGLGAVPGDRVGELIESPLRQPEFLHILPIEATHEVRQHVDLAERVHLERFGNVAVAHDRPVGARRSGRGHTDRPTAPPASLVPFRADLAQHGGVLVIQVLVISRATGPRSLARATMKPWMS